MFLLPHYKINVCFCRSKVSLRIGQSKYNTKNSQQNPEGRGGEKFIELHKSECVILVSLKQFCRYPTLYMTQVVMDQGTMRNFLKTGMETSVLALRNEKKYLKSSTHSYLNVILNCLLLISFVD